MLEMEACLSRRDSPRLARVLRDEGVSPSTLTQLNLLVCKRLSSADFGQVGVVLKSLEILVDNRDLHETLVGLGITHQVLSWFQTLRKLLATSGSPKGSAQTSLVERFYDFLLLLSRSCLPGLERSLTLMELLHTLLESKLLFNVRLEAARTFNSILDSLGRDERKHVQSERMLLQMMPTVAATIRTIGDYELQVSLSEALCRMIPREERVQRANEWFSCSDIAGAFCLITSADFETDCRRFLNFVNRGQGNYRRVWTFPCMGAFLESTELFGPKDDKLDEFWVDFNFGSQCVSFFVDLPQGFLWGSLHLLKEEVARYQLKLQQDGVFGGVTDAGSIQERLTQAERFQVFLFPEGGEAQAILTVHLKSPITHLDSKGSRVQLRFKPELLEELEAAAASVFPGEEGHKNASEQAWASPLPTRPPARRYRKKTCSRTLKVLPLSSPSSDDQDSVATTPSSKWASDLFDQVACSTPLKVSGESAPESPLQVPGGHVGAEPLIFGEESLDFGEDICLQETSCLKRKQMDKDSGVTSLYSNLVASIKIRRGRPGTNVVLAVVLRDVQGVNALVSLARHITNAASRLLGRGFLTDERETPRKSGSARPSEFRGASPEELPQEEVEPPETEEPPQEGEEPSVDMTSGIKEAFDIIKRNLQQHHDDCWQKVQDQSLLSLKEQERHVTSLFEDIRQHRAVLLNHFEKSVAEHLKCLEETSRTYLNMYSQLQSERRRLSDFCEQHKLRLRSLDEAGVEPESGH
ncbi:synaptonemal complex protein 2-like [Syngnathus typhle]|uniref:synaptonemal complex protein 2-like n=1 Tax=Syngnathus typhle TaxID=161592 RepID=UPI002A69B053|nr:synaptonemal complex protein 2-like [Syngnathus typhle]